MIGDRQVIVQRAAARAAKPLAESRLAAELAPTSRLVAIDSDGRGGVDTCVQVRLDVRGDEWVAGDILCVRPLPGRRTSYSTERHAEAARRAALALV
jgi:hypothetical protein